MQRNVAGQIWIVYAFSRTSGLPITGDAANIGATLRQDGGASAPLADAHPDELSGGYYRFDISQAESNAPHLLLIPVSSTANVLVVAVPGALWTEPASQKYAASLAASDVVGNLPALVKAEDDIDFGAVKKAALNAATPAHIQDLPADGSGLTALGDIRIANLATAAALSTLQSLVETLKSLADSCLDATISSRLAAIGYTEPPTAEEIDEKLTEEHGAGGWGQASPVELITKTYTLRDIAGAPVQGAEVWATSDVAGLHRIDIIRITNDLGQATFRFDLPTGTTVWIWHRGSPTPDEELI